MKKMAIALLAVLVVALVGTYFYLDHIVESAIERSSEQAFGVETRVDAATLNLWAGRLGMNRYTVQNPSATSETEHFLSLQEGQIHVPLTALWRDTVHVPQITLDSLTLNLEQRGLNSNYQPILDHFSEFMASDEPRVGPALIVDSMRIRNATVTLLITSEVAGLSDMADLRATIPELHLQDVGAERGGVSLERLTGIVIAAILQAVITSEGVLPEPIRRILIVHLNQLPDATIHVEGDIEWSGTDNLRQRAEEALRKKGNELLDRARNFFNRDTTE